MGATNQITLWYSQDLNSGLPDSQDLARAYMRELPTDPIAPSGLKMEVPRWGHRCASATGTPPGSQQPPVPVSLRSRLPSFCIDRLAALPPSPLWLLFWYRSRTQAFCSDSVNTHSLPRKWYCTFKKERKMELKKCFTFVGTWIFTIKKDYLKNKVPFVSSNCSF